MRRHLSEPKGTISGFNGSSCGSARSFLQPRQLSSSRSGLSCTQCLSKMRHQQMIHTRQAHCARGLRTKEPGTVWMSLLQQCAFHCGAHAIRKQVERYSRTRRLRFLPRYNAETSKICSKMYSCMRFHTEVSSMHASQQCSTEPLHTLVHANKEHVAQHGPEASQSCLV